MQANSYGSTGLDAAVAAEVRAEIERQRHQGRSIKRIAEELGWRRATLGSKVNGETAFSPSELSMVCIRLGTRASDITARAEIALASREQEVAS